MLENFNKQKENINNMKDGQEVFNVDKKNSQEDNTHSLPLNKLDEKINQLKEIGKKRGRKRFFYSIIGIVVIFCFFAYGLFFVYKFLPEVLKIFEKPITQELMSQKIKNEWRFCEKDSDCVKIQLDCCDCLSGGTQAAVNGRYSVEWETVLINECRNKICESAHVCKKGIAKCENNKCIFQEDRKNYFDELKNKCQDDCCLASWEIMLKNSYQEFDELKGCFSGFRFNSLRCETSLKWCEPEQFTNKEDVVCAKEGEVIYNMINESNDQRKCCSGLVESVVYDVDSCVPGNDTTICLNCPNGECGLGENKCNCAQDCKEKIIDTDGDGLSDKDEVKYGTDSNNPDTDGDGYGDNDEISRGYNPLGVGELKR